MLIRNYVADDRDAVVDLWLAVFPRSTGHNDPGTSIDRRMAADDGLFFVATDDANVAGTVDGCIPSRCRLPSGDVAWGLDWSGMLNRSCPVVVARR